MNPSLRVTRVLHLCSNRWNSAIAEYAISSVNAVNHCNQTIIALRGSAVAQRLSVKYSVLSWESFSLLQMIRLVVVVLRFRPDAIITYGGPESALVMILRMFCRFRFIRFFGDAQRAPTLEKSIGFRLQAKFYDHIVLPSLSLAERLKGVSSTAIYLPIGIDHRRFVVREDVTRNPRPTLLILGRLDPVKGHQRAIEIFSELLRIWPSSEPRPYLMIVGKAANLSVADLKQMTSSLASDDFGLIDRQVEDVPKLMNSVHVGWVPSLGSELICRVSCEMLLSGTAVFTSDAGALAECHFPSSGDEYSLAEPNSVIAQKLSMLLQKVYSESLNERRSRSQIASSKFSWEQMGRCYDTLLNPKISP